MLAKSLMKASALALLAAACAFGTAHAKPYKGAEIFTHESQLYGKYVVRMRAAKGSGVISNFFTYKTGSEIPGTPWEEIDIEVFGKDNAQAWQSNIITGLGPTRSEGVHGEGFSFGDAYHTFTVEWTPNYVRWLVDGREVRRTDGGQARNLISAATTRFNIWPPNIPSWVGPWNPAILPVYMFVNWIEYHSWNGSGFTLQWRDDFNSFDTSRWARASHTFAENQADFVPANALTRNGYLVLALTREGQEGYTGTPPTDGGSTPPPPPPPPPPPGGQTACANPVTFTGNSGNFNTGGAVCYRTNSTINGWGCSNFDGRTLTVSGQARSCGQLPLARASDGYYYFSVTAGTYPWASLFTW